MFSLSATCWVEAVDGASDKSPRFAAAMPPGGVQRWYNHVGGSTRQRQMRDGGECLYQVVGDDTMCVNRCSVAAGLMPIVL